MKKKLVSVALIVAILSLCVTGTLAYLQDKDALTNTFTSGSVYIELDEAVVKPDDDGNLVDTGDRFVPTANDSTQEYHLFPGMTVAKDPTLTLQEGSEDAYVAAKLTITGDLGELLPLGETGLLNVNVLASGGLVGTPSNMEASWNDLAPAFVNEDCAVYQEKTADKTWVIYVFVKEIQQAGATVELFKTLTVPATWNSDEMAKLNGMTIAVEAYAVQANSFADCYTAMTTAFASDFDFE